MLLIVEDNETLQFFLRVLAQRLHRRAVFADNGEEALRLFAEHEHEISMVFMDWNLQGRIDGLKCAASIRQRNTNMPIIALTAHASKEHKERCLEAGMNDYLSKPFTSADFARMVERWQPAKQVPA